MVPENNQEILPYLTSVYRQINNMLKVRSEGSELLDHSLEKGLSNEEIIRDVLRSILPRKYGIGKGKITNQWGEMSKQCDVIIYDALHCPNLFIDANRNQVLPIEGVYAVIEIKSQLTRSKLEECFVQIQSVKQLSNNIPDVSLNDLVQIIPPLAYVIAFKDNRTLKTVYNNYVSLNKKYPRAFSSLSYSKKSPGYSHHTNQYYLIEDIVIINKGIVHYMYDGFPAIIQSGVDSFGSFIVSLYLHLTDMKLTHPSLLDYYPWTTNIYASKTKVENEFLDINEARKKRFPRNFN